MKQIINKKMLPAAALLLIAIVVPPVFGLTLSTLSILTMALLYMYWSSAWNIMGGYTGLFALGNGMYIGLGAYITGCLYVFAGITPYIGILIGAVITGLVALLIGFPTFRLQSIFYSLATFALVNATRVIFTNYKKIFGVEIGGSDGFKIVPQKDPANMQFAGKLPYYYIALGLLVVILVASYMISHSKWGFQFRAISANMGAAASLGINVTKTKLRAQFISAFFTAVGGGFYCMFMRYIDPSSIFSGSMSCNIMIMCVVGGANTLWGPPIGALMFYILQRMIVIYAPSSVSGIADLVFGAILIFSVLMMPGGMMNYLETKKEKRIGKRLAQEAMEGGGINQ